MITYITRAIHEYMDATGNLPQIIMIPRWRYHEMHQELCNHAEFVDLAGHVGIADFELFGMIGLWWDRDYIQLSRGYNDTPINPYTGEVLASKCFSTKPFPPNMGSYQ